MDRHFGSLIVRHLVICAALLAPVAASAAPTPEVMAVVEDLRRCTDERTGWHVSTATAQAEVEALKKRVAELEEAAKAKDAPKP